MNALAQTNSEINNALYGYPSQAIEYIKRIGPLELSKKLLKLIDPADLITYTMECELDLSKLGKFRGERTILIGRYPIKLVFRLGSLDMKVIKIDIFDCEHIFDTKYSSNEVNEKTGKVEVLHVNKMVFRKREKYSTITYNVERSDPYTFKFKFKPEIYDQILADLQMVYTQLNQYLKRKV